MFDSNRKKCAIPSAKLGKNNIWAKYHREKNIFIQSFAFFDFCRVHFLPMLLPNEPKSLIFATKSAGHISF